MSKPPNIFFFILDAFRYDAFPFFGCRRQTTPFLNDLLPTGTLFSNAFSTSTWTLPAHVSYLTGLSTFQHNVDYGLNRRVPYPNNFLFLPNILKQAGYESLLLSEQAFLIPTLYADADLKKEAFGGFLPPCGCGFDFMDSIYDCEMKRAFLLDNGTPTLYDALDGIAPRNTEKLATQNWKEFDRLAKRVDPGKEMWPDLEQLYRQNPYFDSRYNLLKQRFADRPADHTGNPCFCMINLHTIQASFCPQLRKEWFQHYFKLNLGIDVPAEQLDFFDFCDPQWLDDTVSTTTWDLLHQYDLMFVDCSVRLLYEFFTEHNLLTETDYLFFLTDHGLGKGETTFSPRNCHHGAFPFDWLVRSPFFARGPAFANHFKTVTQPVSTLDLYPSVVAAAGLEIPHAYRNHLGGKPLQERLVTDTFNRAISVETTVYINEKGEPCMPPAESIDDPDDLLPRHQKATLFAGGNHRLVCIPSADTMHLHDVTTDPLYENPIDDPTILATVSQELLTGMTESIQSTSFPAPQPQEQQNSDQPRDEGIVRSLKALGYY